MAKELAVDAGDGRARAALGRWLAKPARGTSSMVLAADAVGGGAAATLQAWDRDEIVPAVADEILAAWQNHCETAGASTVTGAVVQLSSDGEVRSTYRLRVSAPLPVGLGASVLDAVPLDGTAQSLVVQAQAMAQTSMKMMVGALSEVVRQSCEISRHAQTTTTLLAERLAEVQVSEASARDRAEELSRALAELRAAAPGEAEGAADKFVALLQPVLPHIVQRLMATGTAPVAIVPK